LQAGRYRGQRSAWQVGASAPTPLDSAVVGLSCRRLATAGNGAPGRWGLPPPNPRFSLCSACLADSSLPRATKRLAGGGFRPHTLRFRCGRLVLQAARFCGQRSAWQAGAAAPTFPLFAALGLSSRRLATAGHETIAILCAHLRARIGGVFPNPKRAALSQLRKFVFFAVHI
jgi:hypothetical protein